jgi:hypothetical protein
VYRHTVALLAALCLLSPRALAAPLRADPVQLVYTLGKGAGSCPDVETLRRNVVREMGYDPFLPDAVPRLAVMVERRAGEFWVAMSLRNEAGEIEWNMTTMHSSGPCRELVDALGMSIAIRLEPDPARSSRACPALPAPPVPPAAPAPKCPPVEEVAPAKPVDAVADAVPYRPLIFVGAGPLLAVQVPFAVSPGGTLFVGLRWPHVSIAVEGTGVLPYTAGTDNQRVNTSSLTLGGALCGHFGILFGCGIIDGGGLWWIALPGMPPAKSLPWALVNAGVRVGVKVSVTRIFELLPYADAVGTLTSFYLGTQGRTSVLPPERTVVRVGMAGMVTF